MEKEIKELIRLYGKLNHKLYVYLKYKSTPFKDINDAIPLDSSILDVGCGIGMYGFYLYLKSQKRKVLGVDNNTKKVKYASKVGRHIKDVDFDFVDLNKNYRLGRYDTYLVNDVLHHIPDTSKKRLLRKIYSVMPKAGKLVIKDMHSGSRIKFVLNYINDKVMTLNDRLYFIDKKELIKLLEEIGFKVRYKKVDGYLFPHIMYICTKGT